MERFEKYTDKFKIVCRKCDSEDVCLGVDECGECGNTTYIECNKCGEAYHYHDFKEIKI